MKPNLKVKIGRLELKNPIMTASGTFGYGEEFNENFYDISKLGGIVTKGISLKPREGNPMPRVVETASGMLNSIGLQNVGVDDYIKGKLPYLKKTGALIVANVLGNNTNEYNKIASLLNPLDEIAALEVNISCPNVKKGGVQFGTDPKAAAGLVKSIRKVFKKTLIVKLSPNYHNIPLIAKSVADAGADAISLINTITAMAIDAETRRPILSAVTGGLSGPAIKPIALRMVWEASKAVKIPVIGIGGIMNITDVVEFLLAGASAVQIGTGNFLKPSIAFDLVKELEEYLQAHDISDVKELIGGLRV
ncbi:MAG: dihydroorotate dehydrogenase [Deltaproteobacteria bacterium]|nr:dihydroorotate dehydrogenase [Deltaproteobacteria bacterium]